MNGVETLPLDDDRQPGKPGVPSFRGLRLAVGISLLLGASACVGWTVNRWLARYVPSEAFRGTVTQATCHGLHISGEYAPITRTGWLTADTADFHGAEGARVIKSLAAQEVRATLNPLGLILRRWELSRIDIARGQVELQKVEPQPAKAHPSKPWYHWLFPNRVYLREIVVGSADVTWRLRGKAAGLYGVGLRITPRGRDFHYEGEGGVLRTPLVSELALRQARVLVTRQWVTVEEAVFESAPDKSGRLMLKGRAGLLDDRKVSATLWIDRVPIRALLAREWLPSVSGRVTGKVAGTMEGSSLATADASVQMDAGGCLLGRGSFLDRFAVITGRRELQEMKLQVCAFEGTWRRSGFELSRLAIESRGVFRVEGTLSGNAREVRGKLEVGLAQAYRHWLPHDGVQIFDREHDGYRWTTVHLDGTWQAPVDDLTPRVKKLIASSPSALFQLLGREIVSWFQ